jgi:hypothetical protein
MRGDLLWALVDYQEPSGRIAQVDAVVLGFHALYLVEIKSWPGTVTGNSLDWVNVRPDGGRLLKSNPYHRCAEVARILAGGLDRVWREPCLPRPVPAGARAVGRGRRPSSSGSTS